MIKFLEEYKLVRTFPTVEDFNSYDYCEKTMHMLVYKPKEGNDYIVYVNYSINADGKLENLDAKIKPEVTPAPMVTLEPTALTENVPNYAIDFIEAKCYVKAQKKPIFDQQMQRLETLIQLVDEYLNSIVETYDKNKLWPNQED